MAIHYAESRGLFRPTCSCGWHSVGFLTRPAAESLARAHEVHCRSLPDVEVEITADPSAFVAAVRRLQSALSGDEPVTVNAAGEYDPFGRFVLQRDRPPQSPARRQQVGITHHSSVCVDDEGKVECVCGLDDEPWSSIEPYDRERDDRLVEEAGQ